MTAKNVYTVSQIREIEALAAEQFGISESEMMQRAGQAALYVLKDCWPNARYITVVCGKGNNAGDGYMLAYLAHRLGLHVLVQQAGGTDQLSQAAQAALALCQKSHVHIETFNGTVKSADVVVDALLGIGLRNELSQAMLSVIEAVNQSHSPVMALDMPSGVHADTAAFHTTAVKADVTATFVGLKPGLLTGMGLAKSGKVYVDDLQLPEPVFSQVSAMGETLQYSDFPVLLDKRRLNANKSDFGHLLVVGGNIGYNGAVRMAAETALRLGVGLVSVATHPNHAPFVNMAYPEIMSHPIHKAKQLLPLIQKATAIVLGPGLGQGPWASALFKTTLASRKPMVIDADGLNLLAKHPQKNADWILTPHPGEAARLLNMSVEAIQANRIKSVKALYQQYDGVCILKGAGSLLSCDTLPCQFLRDGNPGMASGGMGDALSGALGGLLAQGLSVKSSATRGLCLHAHAGDIAAKNGEHGLLATDVIGIIKQLIN